MTLIYLYSRLLGMYAKHGSFFSLPVRSQKYEK